MKTLFWTTNWKWISLENREHFFEHLIFVHNSSSQCTKNAHVWNWNRLLRACVRAYVRTQHKRRSFSSWCDAKSPMRCKRRRFSCPKQPASEFDSADDDQSIAERSMNSCLSKTKQVAFANQHGRGTNNKSHRWWRSVLYTTYSESTMARNSFFVFTRSECTAKEQLMNKLDGNGINHSC